MIRRALVLAIAVAMFPSSFALAAKPHFKISDWGNARVKSAFVQPTDQAFVMPSEGAEPVAEAKRSPASDQRKRENEKTHVGDINMLSQELKDLETGKDGMPGLFTLKEPNDLQKLFNKYRISSNPRLEDDVWFVSADHAGKYNVDPDVQFVMNRLAPLAPFRGILWRMAPLTHQSTMTHVMMLNMVRSFAENTMTFFPDTQWQVYMAFLGTPDARLLSGGMKKCVIHGKAIDISLNQFCVENDMVDYLVAEVRPVLDQSIRRLSRMPVTHTIGGKKNERLYFDNRIRFGGRGWSNTSAEAYDQVDQFAEIGNAERLLSMARFSRRNSVIAQLAAYNWNGNVALRKEIGKRIGIGSELDKLDADPFSLEGLSREDRVGIARLFAGTHGTFGVRTGRGGNSANYWMPIAYDYLSKYADYSLQAWRDMESRFKEDPKDDFLLDPDLFRGRQDQIRRGIENLAEMFPLVKPGGARPQPAKLYGAISGDPVQVDMYGFFHNPPQSVASLMPTQWAAHQDIDKLPVPAGLVRVTNPEVSTYVVIAEKYKGLAEERLKNLAKRRQGARSGTAAAEGMTYIEMKMQQLKQKGRPLGVSAADFEMRNYLWGRAVGWDVGTYKKMFPGVGSPSDVMHQQQVLGEVRGGRVIVNSLAIFIK